MVRLTRNNEILHCYPKGKKSNAAVGDTVFITLSGDTQAVITGVADRRNLFYRSDASRSKQFAANIDQILLVVAVEPDFSMDLLGRALVAANSAEIDFSVVLNKSDLANLEQAQARLAEIASLGIPIITLSALDKAQTNNVLQPILMDKTTLLLGQSGMGKSSLLNALIPQAMAATNEFSSALGTGKHTTTHTRLYDLPFAGHLIDSPGFQAFGLQHLGDGEIQLGFPEFDQYIENCKFYNCKHLQEPGCGILKAVADGNINSNRYDLYKRILQENAANKRY